MYWISGTIKVSSRVKNHHFTKFAIFRWLNRAHQELSFKKNSRKKCFFWADLWSTKIFSMLYDFNWSLTSPVILDIHAAAEPSLSRSLTEIVVIDSIVLTVFPWILEVIASKERKTAYPFSSLTPRRKMTKSFCKEWASKLAESDKGSYYNQEKWLKDDKAPEKPIETTAESSFTSFLASGVSFLERQAAKRATKSREVPCHIKIERRTVLKVYCSGREASGKTPGSGLLLIFPGTCRTFRKCIE